MELKFRVSTRELCLLVVIVGVALGWWIDHRRIEAEVQRGLAARAAFQAAALKQQRHLQVTIEEYQARANRAEETANRWSFHQRYPQAQSRPLPSGKVGIFAGPGPEAELLGEGSTREGAWEGTMQAVGAALRGPVAESVGE